ncbi:hypothetical protein I3842_15G112100 [Carya illinoinensis]|uniref:Uncharacterized protein n=1 Tax=Carya illinoinensis TaxID=32201 RepID=A0A922DB97_CARIL|nr:hypothetical protein I3842_15G112100 [Carya illinoinensis]
MPFTLPSISPFLFHFKLELPLSPISKPPFHLSSFVFHLPYSKSTTRNLRRRTFEAESPPFPLEINTPNRKLCLSLRSSASAFEAERHQSSASPFDAVSLPKTLTKALHFSLPFPSFSFKFSLVQDIYDVQWRNFRGNLPVLTVLFGIFTLVANKSRAYFGLRERGISIVWQSQQVQVV